MITARIYDRSQLKTHVHFTTQSTFRVMLQIAPVALLKKFKTVRGKLRGTTDVLTEKIEKIGGNILQTEGVVNDMESRGAILKQKVSQAQSHENQGFIMLLLYYLSPHVL